MYLSNLGAIVDQSDGRAAWRKSQSRFPLHRMLVLACLRYEMTDCFFPFQSKFNRGSDGKCATCGKTEGEHCTSSKFCNVSVVCHFLCDDNDNHSCTSLHRMRVIACLMRSSFLTRLYLYTGGETWIPAFLPTDHVYCIIGYGFLL